MAAGLVLMVLRAPLHSLDLKDQNWKSLVGKLQMVDNKAVAAVAHDYLTPSEGLFVLQPVQIWKAVGGYDGLSKMRDNAQIMLELAAFVRETDFDSSVIVAERMRREEVLVRESVRRLELAQFTYVAFSKLTPSAVFDVQQAAAFYYLMRERLFALYKASLEGLYPALSQAV